MLAIPIVEAISSVFWIRVADIQAEVVGPSMGGMSIEYEYKVNGRQYTGHRYAFIEPEIYMSKDDLMAIQGGLREYPACFVAPWDHQRSVLVRELPINALLWRMPWLVIAVAFYLMRRRMLVVQTS